MQEFAPIHIQKMIEQRKSFFSQVEVKLWNEKNIVELLARSYPNCLDRYLRIMNTIQRCDIARGFILHSYGGLYMDIDYEPNESIQEFFQDSLLWKSKKVIVGSNDLLGVNNAWIYSSSNHFFWEKYLSMAFSEVESPSLVNIFIGLVFPTWSIISSTGPEVYNKLKKFIEVDDRVYKKWGEHGRGSQPTWFNKLACTQQTLLVLLLIVFSFGFFFN
jgi:mannosyltransferase OCH1-like enzyme